MANILEHTGYKLCATEVDVSCIQTLSNSSSSKLLIEDLQDFHEKQRSTAPDTICGIYRNLNSKVSEIFQL